MIDIYSNDIELITVFLRQRREMHFHYFVAVAAGVRVKKDGMDDGLLGLYQACRENRKDGYGKDEEQQNASTHKHLQEDSG
jgi:hypothetical protein